MATVAHHSTATLDEDALRRATQAAVEESRPIAAKLARSVTRLVARLDAADVSALADGDELVRELTAVDVRLSSAVTEELTDLIDRQLKAIDSFNVALFGRTGAGKSSLIEALSGGDGHPISLGESDWTTEVRPVRWASCRLYDTPGIAGWGRTVSRADLEARARDAVAVADVVLLCFDSQSQQAAEFKRVAEWIAMYGKPVIAVLNCRNALWRFPTRVSRRASRIQLSRAVAEHAQNITAELAGIGLLDVPIVAIQGKRAVFARAREPYAGPDERTLRKHRQEIGPERLLRWSNVALLETLLVAAIETDAVALRFGSLHRQFAGALEKADGQLKDLLQRPARDQAVEIERGIERLLAILGAPEALAEEEAGASFDELLNALEDLESARGGRFEAPAVGEAQRHATNVITAKLAPLRAKAQRKAEKVIDGALSRRTTVGEAEFVRRVFDRKAIAAAAAEATEELTRHLSRRVGLVAGDVQADLRQVAPKGALIEGSAGKTLRRVSVVAKGTAGAAGIGGGALSIAILAWHPVGWTLGGVALVSGAVGVVSRFFGKRTARRAEAKREQALARARANARRAVNRTFDELRDELADRFAALCREALVKQTGAAAHQALALRQISESAKKRRASIRRRLSRIPPTENPSDVLSAAARACEARAQMPGGRAARMLWLGEAWIDDPEGLDPTLAGAQPPPRRAVPQRRFRRIVGRVESALRGATAVPRPGAGTRWLSEVALTLADDPGAQPMLEELRGLAAAPRPRVVVVGDYSSGKSSFIRRLLVDSGQEGGIELSIKAHPATDTIREYEWNGLTLVDTPGFQSGRGGHAELTRSALPDAAAVLFIFNPNLVVGDQDDVRHVLLGDPSKGVASKLDRTLFIINRSDDLGINPLDDPDEFMHLVGRKEQELRQALASVGGVAAAGVTVDETRVLCMASDPFGLVGEDSAHSSSFDSNRSWDGFDEFFEAIEALRPRLAANAGDVSVLHGGLARLGRLAEQASNEAADVQAKLDQIARLREDCAEALLAGEALAADRRAALVRAVGDFLDGLLASAMRTKNKDRRAAVAKRLAGWTTDPEFAEIFSEWQTATGEEIATWSRATLAALNRRIASQAFVGAFAHVEDAVPLRFLEADGGASLRYVARGAATAGRSLSRLGDPARAFTAFWVLTGRFPADVAGLASRLGRAGAMLQVVGGVLDVWSLVRDLDAEKERDAKRSEDIRRLHEHGRQWAARVLDGDSDTPGALAPIEEGCRLLRELDEHFVGTRSRLSRQRAAVQKRAAAYATAVIAAEKHLGLVERR